MNRFILSLLAVNIFATLSVANADEGISSSIQLSQVKNPKLAIFMGTSTATAASISANDPYLVFLNNAALKPHQKIFHGRAKYTVNIASEKLNSAFFKNLVITQRLVGSNNALKLVSHQPYAFSSKMSALGGLVKLTSSQVMNVYEGYALTDIRAIAQLSRRSDVPVRVIVQRSSNFNMFFDRGFMVTFLYRGQAPGTTDVEVISAVVVNQMPPISIAGSTKSALVGYANRLSQGVP